MKTRNAMRVWTLICGLTATSLMVGFSACTEAQEPLLKKSEAKEKVFTEADRMPEYPGGFPALIQFIGEKLTYPKKAESQGTEGTVHVGFVVDQDGKVTDIGIEKGVSPELDEAAKAIVEQLPNWTPGEEDGKKVSVKMVLPIKFEMGS